MCATLSCQSKREVLPHTRTQRDGDAVGRAVPECVQIKTICGSGSKGKMNNMGDQAHQYT